MSGADLTLLMPGDVAQLPDDQLKDLMERLALEQQKRGQKKPCPPAGPAPTRRSSRSRSPKPRTKSMGPSVDAMNEDQVEFDTLWREVIRTSRGSILSTFPTTCCDSYSPQAASRTKRRRQLGPMQRADIASKGGDDPTMDQAREEASRIASTAGAYQHRKLQLNRL